MILVPLLAGLGMAGVVKQRDESVADVAKVADSINNANVADSIDVANGEEVADGAEVCCNTTPCFGGCFVNGGWAVSLFSTSCRIRLSFLLSTCNMLIVLGETPVLLLDIEIPRLLLRSRMGGWLGCPRGKNDSFGRCMEFSTCTK